MISPGGPSEEQSRHQCSGSNLVQKDFSSGVNINADSTSPKNLSDETINRGPVCERTQNILRTR